MSFQFVENGKIDGAARKLIRSHVMKGKNVGKVRPPRRRKGVSEVLRSRDTYKADVLIPTVCRITGSCETPTSYNSTDECETKGISVPQSVGNSFSLLAFPCELHPYMRGLITQFWSVSGHAVYPSDFCLPLNVPRWLWFEYLQSDEAFFHSVLAMSEVCVDSLLGRNETSPQALLHLSNTYRCIKQNLEKHGTPPDSTIAAVMSMAIHEDLRGQPSRSKVHVDALERMVELRGGIGWFRDHQMLLQKICRADVQYAFHCGSHPRFYRDEFPRGMIMSLLGESVSQEELLGVASDARVYDPELRGVFVDLMSISCLFNDGGREVRLDPFAYQEILISVCYRLLHHHPLGGDGYDNDNENACYLGLLALVSTLFFYYRQPRRLPYDLLAERLRHGIERALCNKLVEGTTLLWLLFAGGISVFDDSDQAWLIPRIKTLLTTLNINSWRTARSKIRTLPWIDVAHNKPGEELWQAVVLE